MRRNVQKLLCNMLIFAVILAQHTYAKEGYRKLRYTSRSQMEAANWQGKVRTRLFNILKFNDLIRTRDRIPLAPVVLSAKARDGYILKEIEINTTTHRRMQIVVTLPADSTRQYPAIVCIHGHGHNRYSVYEPESIYKGFAAKLAESKKITISADVGQHEVYESERILMGERLWDLMRCVDYLESLPQVDLLKIGCAGLSLGGEMAMWLGAMDERIAAVVSSGFLTKMDQMEQNHCMCWKFDGLRELVDFADIYSLIAPRPLLCQNGLKEPETQFYVPIAKTAMQEIKVIYRDFNCPDAVSLQVHPEGHVIDLPGLMKFFKLNGF
ncbi:acetylxylan esterase [candidate division KSB1 bacterium]|nr:acetylxylan esterase [candidate division KSB1 bacterium]